MNRKFSDESERNLIEVQVLPDEKHIKSGLWSRFVTLLKRLRYTPEGKISEAFVRNYLKQSCIDAFENKNRTRLQNRKVVAEIDEIREHIRGEKDKNTKSNLMFEQEYEAKQAEIRLKNAEATAIETETTIKVMRALKEKGFDFSLSLEQGKLQIFILDTAAIPEPLLSPPEADALATVLLTSSDMPIDNAEDDREANTKLDLAQAYAEMGDKDGARDLLEEVVNDGSPSQREIAQLRLMALEI
jgi:FimV-like protein